ncbi:SpoIIE family protein phosphatase [uncultured Microscilla sp.]|uniref:SpoIIE family protein phosphatase n=1 Tax=uncultured Microscilla sp. TaxID=432653 RepID=UPI00263A2516|nr:SpoIIE family protein phosphatase [uncultured Microscilla sp.]
MNKKNLEKPVPILFIGLCLITTLFTSLWAQPSSNYIDSLQQVLAVSEGKQRVDLLNELSDLNSRKELNEAITLAKEALQLSQKIKYPLGQAYASYNLGHHLISQGSYSQALDYLFVALKIYEQVDVALKKAQVLRAIGHVYNGWQAHQKAVEYYRQQLKIGLEIKDTATIGSAYLNLSYAFVQSKKPNRAIQFIDESLKYSLATHDTLRIIIARANRAGAYFQLGKRKKALQLLLEVHEWYKNHYYQDYEQYACADIAGVYLVENQLSNALIYATKGYLLAINSGSKPKAKEISDLLYKIHKRKGNTSKALHYLEKSRAYQDSILNDQKKNELASQDLLHLLEKYEVENKSLKEYRATNERFKARRNVIGIFILFILVFVLVIGFLLYRNNKFNQERTQLMAKNRVDIILQNKELKRQHQAIEEKNDQLKAQHLHIFNSIRSAETIQQAILPQEALLRDLLFDYFIIFRPRNIVSGDFYWLSSVGTRFQTTTESPQRAKTLVAVVDSTGHGVPGAFMSMIGNTLLDRIVKIERVTTPSEILKRMNLEIFLALQQNSNNNDEGMEMGICSFEKLNDKETKVVFSGARRPLYVVHQALSITEKTIETYKGSRRYLGGKRNIGAQFFDHELVLNSGDAIYISSDGFVDQNSDDRKKFGSEQLVKVLLENAHWAMPKQQQLLTQTLDKHQGSSEQRDDILLMGVRIT